jgi:isopentenyl-diphosphate delta-isomerase
MSKADQTARRKVDHVRINLEEQVDSRITTGLDRLRFVPRALPEIDLDSVSTEGEILGIAFGSPLLISSMTGGADDLAALNIRLAEAAEARGIPMGVGSQRAAIQSGRMDPSFDLRRHAPGALLLANLGAVQLNYGYGLDECRRAVEMIGAKALILHFNALQEAVQPEGDTRWAGILPKVEALAKALDLPIIAKEVGWGFAEDDARRLVDAGIAAIDVAGAGGTSWSEVEKHRAATEAQRRVAGAFIGWGLPTADSIRAVRRAAPELPIIASGGLRDGIDVCKCLVLGASLAGLAGPFLRAAADSTQAVVEEIDVLTRTLRIAMFAIGAQDLASLRDHPRLVEA